MTKDDAIRKIQKLLSLSEGTHSEEEMLSAIGKAHEMAAKFGLSLEVIGEEKEVERSVSEEYTTSAINIAKRYNMELARVISSNFRCTFLISGYRTKRAIFIGFEEDVQIAKMVYEAAGIFMKKEAVRTYDRLYEAEKKQYGCMVSKNVTESYCLGFVQGLRNQFKKNYDANEGYALMAITPTAVIEHVAKKKLKGYNSSVTYRRLDGESYDKGIMDGEGFNRQIA